MATRRAKQAQQQQQLLIIGAGALVAIAVAVVAIVLISDSANVEVCAYDDESCYGPYLTTEQGLTEEGFGVIGSAEAPIMVAEVVDFACPHCVDYHPIFRRLIETYAPTGQAQFVFMGVNWTGGNNSSVAMQAAFCAGEQDAFWQMQEEIFELSDNEGANGFDRETLVNMADEMNLNKSDMESCMNNSRSRRGVSEAINLAQTVGVTGTPSILLSYDGGNTWQRFTGSREFDSVSLQILAAQPTPADS